MTSPTLRLLKEKTAGQFEWFLLSWDICNECLGDLVQRDGEKVCSSCGVVAPSFNVQNVVPLGETRTPTNNLAFGRNLGGTLQEKGLWRVLADGPLGNQDLPLRARQVRIIIEKTEHPRIRAMLREGRRLCHKYGFDRHKDSQSVRFSNMLGKIIRMVGAYTALINDRMPTKKLAAACLLVAFRYSRLAPPRNAEKLKVSEDLYRTVVKLYEHLRTLQKF